METSKIAANYWKEKFFGLSTLAIQIEILICLQQEREFLRLRNFCGDFLLHGTSPFPIFL